MKYLQLGDDFLDETGKIFPYVQFGTKNNPDYRIYPKTYLYHEINLDQNNELHHEFQPAYVRILKLPNDEFRYMHYYYWHGKGVWINSWNEKPNNLEGCIICH